MSETQEQVSTPEENKEVVTEVTSVAKEELKSGVKQELPTAEELAQRANASFMNGLHELERILKSGKLSARGMRRAIIAILDLPTAGLPVGLQKGLEQYTFALGQRVLRDRFILTQYHISQEQKIYKQLLDLQKIQQDVITKMKEEGKSEEEIKDMQEKHKQSMITLEKVLRGEDIGEEIPLAVDENEKVSETQTNEGEKNE